MATLLDDSVRRLAYERKRKTERETDTDYREGDEEERVERRS